MTIIVRTTPSKHVATRTRSEHERRTHRARPSFLRPMLASIGPAPMIMDRVQTNFLAINRASRSYPSQAPREGIYIDPTATGSEEMSQIWTHDIQNRLDMAVVLRVDLGRGIGCNGTRNRLRGSASEEKMWSPKFSDKRSCLPRRRWSPGGIPL